MKAIAAERERAAVRKAEQVLRRFAARTGALPIPGRIVPTALDNVSLGVSIENMFAARHEFWRLPEPLQAAIAFVKRHPLRGFDWSHPVEGYGANSPVTVEFDGLLAGDVPMQRVLTVTFVPFRGATALRVDAQAAWIYPRSPREVVPKGARKIDIRYPRRKEVNIRKVSPADIDSPLVTRQVTDPAKVARIIRWFDALNVVQPGPVVNCMAIITTTATFMFRSASGAELASATVPSQPANGCDAINFFVGGKQQPSLIDSTPRQGMAFVDRVQRLLGVRLGPRIVAR